MSRRRRPARADRAPGAGPERPEARPGGAGRLRPLMAWLVAVGLLAVVVAVLALLGSRVLRKAQESKPAPKAGITEAVHIVKNGLTK